MNTRKPSPPKGMKDSFGEFFQEPSRESLNRYLQSHVGEGRDVDFKREWLPKHEVARMILGFANTCDATLIFGVSENDDGSFEAIGLESLKDKADFSKELKDLLPTTLLEKVELWDLSYKNSGFEKLEGKLFQVVRIEYNPERIPFLPKKGTTDLKPTAIYIRRDGETVEANHDELESVINRRIETKSSSSKELDLKNHLEQLKVLYGEQPRRSALLRALDFSKILGLEDDEEGETYTAFVKRMIRLKQRTIVGELAIPREIIESDNKIQQVQKQIEGIGKARVVKS
ncbi:helix-turn-helix domain-containing protein [Agrobacterium tumefaciens]|uniref:AlbA family DNA-binding domain-containing protein n=1 Tax=Agrobacterium tumefaciens TaxID=358 RepID=UPI00101A79FC|nr:ATP-binding protein [Agrobacterium tumefaciens]UXS04516.1 ATP-binding protein [Agrobacterium tumefaciens]